VYKFAIEGKHAIEIDSYLKFGGGKWSIGEERKSILDDDKDYMSRSRQNVQEESSLWS